MARGLGDVLHHFDPALASGTGAPRRRPAPRDDEPRAFPDPERGEEPRVLTRPERDEEPRVPAEERPQVVGVPLERSDLLRAASLWNLAVEVARLGGRAEVLLPRDPGVPAAADALGVGVRRADPSALPRDAREARERLAADRPAGDPALVLAGLPGEVPPESVAPEIDRLLLFFGPDARARQRAEVLARRWIAADPGLPLGLIVHGASSIREARDAFERLAGPLEHACGRPIVSYGLLVDDLALYRSLVERRPCGLTRPQSSAARALGDVARLLLEDAGDAK